MRAILLLLLFSVSTALAQTTVPLRGTRPAGSLPVKVWQPIAAPAPVKRIGLLPTITYTDGRISLTLDTTSLTTLAIRRLPDSTLVRTLWAGVRFPAGLNTVYPASYNAYAGQPLQWDGTDDMGVTVPAGNYLFELLSNNVTATWRGVIGNSSFVLGNTSQMHRGYQFIRQMVEVGDYAYYDHHYLEGDGPVEKFNKSNPQVKFDLFPRGYGSGTGSEYLCTDGTRVYFSRYDHLAKVGNQPHRNRTWISALTVSNDAPYTFSSGTTYTPAAAPTFPEQATGLILSDSVSNHIAGMAVQRTGSALLVSYPDKGQIRVFNKLTGAQTATIRSLSSPRQLAVDGSDNIWVVSGTNTVAKYSLSNGALTSVLTLSGITTPMSVAVSTDGATVYVVDKATQQVRAFANSDGTALWTLGQSGGYTNTSTVADDRFYFSDLSGGVNYAAVCPTNDGSFWVTDVGNSRVQHFSSARAYIDNIAYVVSSYNSVVDANDSTRVFSSYQEFSVDYSKPFATSWKLTRNYRNQVPAVYLGVGNLRQAIDQFGVFPCLATLSNGRTYSMIKEYIGSSNYTLVELIPSAPLRFTTIKFTSPVWLESDGSLKYTEQANGVITWKRRLLTGFDSSNNPTWATAVTEAQAPVDRYAPVDETGTPDRRAGLRTQSGKIVSFAAGLTRIVDGVVRGLGFHLGLIRPGATDWWVKTARATSGPAYRGDYPTDGKYDIGNHGPGYRPGAQDGYGGGDVTTKDALIFWPYYGEFWKGAQTNFWQIVHESGLFVARFGATNAGDFNNRNIPGMAGGVHNGTVVRFNRGYRLWHGEEGGYSGIDGWDVDGVKNIKRQFLTVVTSTANRSFLAKPSTGTDLLAGLPRTDTLRAATAGWSFTSTMIPGRWQLETSVRSSDRFLSPDLSILFSQDTTTQIATRPLPVNGTVASWSLSAGVGFAGTLGTESKTDGAGKPISGGAYLELLDATGKIITRFYKLTQFEQNPASSTMMANTVSLVSAPPYGPLISSFDASQPLVISRSAGKLTISYAGYSATNLNVFETGADPTRPAVFRIVCFDKSLRRDRGAFFEYLRWTGQ